MEKEFIPFPQSSALKELGFDEPCFVYYRKSNENKLAYPNTGVAKNSLSINGITAPTFSQAFRWFREKGYDVKIAKESPGLYFGFYWTGAAWVNIAAGTYESVELDLINRLITEVKKI